MALCGELNRVKVVVVVCEMRRIDERKALIWRELRR